MSTVNSHSLNIDVGSYRPAAKTPVLPPSWLKCCVKHIADCFQLNMTVHTDRMQMTGDILWLLLEAGQLAMLTNTCKIRRRVCDINRNAIIRVEGMLQASPSL